MKRKILVALSFILIATLLSGCGTPILPKDLTNARQTSYTAGYNDGYAQGLAQGSSSGYSKGYTEGYMGAAQAILAVWPAGSTPPVVSAPVIAP